MNAKNIVKVLILIQFSKKVMSLLSNKMYNVFIQVLKIDRIKIRIARMSNSVLSSTKVYSWYGVIKAWYSLPSK